MNFIVPAQPLNLTLHNVTSTSFCISYYPPTGINQNGPITSYTVTYQGELFNTTEYNTTVSVNTVVYPLIESSDVCISDLEEYNNYTVLIRANNGAGEGVVALIVIETLKAGLYNHIVFSNASLALLLIVHETKVTFVSAASSKI